MTTAQTHALITDCIAFSFEDMGLSSIGIRRSAYSFIKSGDAQLLAQSIGVRRKAGFYVWAIANIAWAVYFAVGGHWSIVAMYGVYEVTSIVGIVKWPKEEE